MNRIGLDLLLVWSFTGCLLEAASESKEKKLLTWNSMSLGLDLESKSVGNRQEYMAS
jgi:hypothetical protein